jgi:hypothetical protein
LILFSLLLAFLGKVVILGGKFIAQENSTIKKTKSYKLILSSLFGEHLKNRWGAF